MRKKKQKCSVNRCTRLAQTKKLCQPHYDRKRRTGSVRKRKPLWQRLHARSKSYCPCCDKIKALSRFTKDKQAPDGIAVYCKVCTKTKKAAQYKKHFERRRNTFLQRNFGITWSEYIILAAKQNNLCAICERIDRRRLSVDHDHLTKKIRGLLCSGCNLGLGKFKDSIQLLRRAVEYLKATQE